MSTHVTNAQAARRLDAVREGRHRWATTTLAGAMHAAKPDMVDWSQAQSTAARRAIEIANLVGPRVFGTLAEEYTVGDFRQLIEDFTKAYVTAVLEAALQVMRTGRL